MERNIKEALKNALIENESQKDSDIESEPKKVISIYTKINNQRKSSSEGNNTINGSNNIIGSNNHIIIAGKIIEKTVVETRPGEEHITDEQFALLKSLVLEVSFLAKKTGTKPDAPGAIYNKLFLHLAKPKKRATIGKARLIPRNLFDSSEAFLRQWIGKLTSDPSDALPEDEWRKKKYSYIKLNIKKYGWEERFETYAMDLFGTTSLKECSNEDLAKAYRKVAYWKTALKKQVK